MSRAARDALIERLSVGTTVDVFYDPDDPKNAVLQTGAGGTPFGLLFALVIVAVGIWMLQKLPAKRQFRTRGESGRIARESR